MTGLPERSPICDKALTLDELSKLPMDTELIIYYWHLGDKRHVRYVSVTAHDGLDWLVFVDDGDINEETVSDIGLVPYRHSSDPIWNAIIVTILATDEATLPDASACPYSI